MKNYNHPTGYTLAELLVYLGIFSILLVVLTQMFTTVVNVSLESQSASAIDQNNRFLLNRLTYDIGRSKTLAVPFTLGQQGSTLTMVSNTGENISYTQSGSSLLLTINGVGQSLTNYNTQISNLNFRHLGNTGLPVGNDVPAIGIGYTLTSISHLNSLYESVSTQTVISLRPYQ